MMFFNKKFFLQNVFYTTVWVTIIFFLTGFVKLGMPELRRQWTGFWLRMDLKNFQLTEVIDESRNKKYKVEKEWVRNRMDALDYKVVRYTLKD